MGSQKSPDGGRRPGSVLRSAAAEQREAERLRDAASLRAELLRLDARDLAHVQDQIRDLLAPESESLRKYRRAYERSLTRGGRPVRRQRVVSAALQADVILIGDYHTLPEAQRAVLALALELAQKRPLVLGLEMVRTDQQDALDAFIEGRSGDREFLDAIAYATSWPFPWAHYRPLLDAARRGGWTVLALDSRGSASARDRQAAAILAANLELHPDAVHLAMVGDLHLAPAHLPRQVLAARPQTRLVVVHQNEPHIYHDLVARGLDLRASAVLLGPGRFCLMNATPLRRERSYLAWIESRWGEGRGAISDPIAELEGAVERLADLLGADVPQQDWDVRTGDNLPFLAELEQVVTDPARIARVRREIVRRGRSLVRELGIAYMRTPTADDVAELAIRILQEEAGEPLPTEPAAGEGQDAVARGLAAEVPLLAAIRREALGFMASCLLHPFRGTDTVPVTDPGALERRPSTESVGLRARELYAALEARIRRRRPLRLSPRLREMRAEEQWAVSVDVGRRLGRQLFLGLVDGSIERRRVRALLAPPHRRDRRQRERQAILELAALAVAPR